MRPIDRILAGVAVVVALAAGPAAAQAGTVSVEEVPAREAGAFSLSRVHFTAAPGETNAVTIDLAPGLASEGGEGPTVVVVRDTGAPLMVGSGCSLLDAEAATCTLHRPHGVENSPGCGNDCFIPIPGSGWQDAERIDLADGNDTFFSSSGGIGLTGWPTEVDGGSGDDSITTGNGDDEITPGQGDDTVRPGEGQNRVIADPQPDGDDTIDLAEHSSDALDYSARSEPLRLFRHVIGGADEADRIGMVDLSIVEIRGGSGDDDFRALGEQLSGGPGDDTLIGTPDADTLSGDGGDDTIRGGAGGDRLYGGAGADVVSGGAGDDRMEEFGRGEDRLFGGRGKDVIRSGPGPDSVEGGVEADNIDGEAGDDRVAGGGGNDRVEGGPGNDEVDGGSGNDLLSGAAGRDDMRGGKGEDRLRAAYLDPSVGAKSGIDTAVDSLSCGPRKDIAVANPWDRVTGCETVRTVGSLAAKSTR
jgi:Ca2+-binding RTX toxin-like protein